MLSFMNKMSKERRMLVNGNLQYLLLLYLFFNQFDKTKYLSVFLFRTSFLFVWLQSDQNIKAVGVILVSYTNFRLSVNFVGTTHYNVFTAFLLYSRFFFFHLHELQYVMVYYTLSMTDYAILCENIEGNSRLQCILRK